MTRRRQRAVKTLLLAFTAVAACVIPTLSLSAFLYLIGAVFAGLFMFVVGMLFDLVHLYVEFRAFEQRLDEQSRRAFGWKQR